MDEPFLCSCREPYWANREEESGRNSYRITVKSSCCTAKMGRYCLCSAIDFFFANSLLASLFSFM